MQDNTDEISPPVSSNEVLDCPLLTSLHETNIAQGEIVPAINEPVIYETNGKKYVKQTFEYIDKNHDMRAMIIDAMRGINSMKFDIVDEREEYVILHIYSSNPYIAQKFTACFTRLNSYEETLMRVRSLERGQKKFTHICGIAVPTSICELKIARNVFTNGDKTIIRAPGFRYVSNAKINSRAMSKNTYRGILFIPDTHIVETPEGYSTSSNDRIVQKKGKKIIYTLGEDFIEYSTIDLAFVNDMPYLEFLQITNPNIVIRCSEKLATNKLTNIDIYDNAETPEVLSWLKSLAHVTIHSHTYDRTKFIEKYRVIARKIQTLQVINSNWDTPVSLHDFR